MNLRQKRDLRRLTRQIIQIIFFLWMPALYTSAFSGVRYVIEQIRAGKPIEQNAFLVMMIALCGFTILFGRFFCGFACAFGSLGDAVRALYVFICKKLKKKPITMKAAVVKKLKVVKYFVLAIIAVTCFTGVYSKAKGFSPWDVFSMLHARNFKLGGYTLGVVLLVLIVIGMCFQERFFCRVLCPMGAVFSLLPVLPIFSYSRSKAGCIRGCSACSKKCPMDLNLPYEDEDGSEATGECIRCGKCQVVCPRQNVCPNVVYMMNGEERSIK